MAPKPRINRYLSLHQVYLLRAICPAYGSDTGMVWHVTASYMQHPIDHTSTAVLMTLQERTYSRHEPSIP